MDARSDPSILQKHSDCPVWRYSCCTGIKPITLCTLISVRERAHNVNMSVLTRASRVYLTRLAFKTRGFQVFLGCIQTVFAVYIGGICQVDFSLPIGFHVRRLYITWYT